MRKIHRSNDWTAAVAALLGSTPLAIAPATRTFLTSSAIESDAVEITTTQPVDRLAVPQFAIRNSDNSTSVTDNAKM
jgi:hypothetical protein